MIAIPRAKDVGLRFRSAGWERLACKSTRPLATPKVSVTAD
jgi:hypothetical protein